MSSKKLPAILKLFYMTGLRYLPVVKSSGIGEDGESSILTDRLLGFISRHQLDQEMADLERAYRSYDSLPESILVTGSLQSDLIGNLTGADHVPVLDEFGDQIIEWESSEILRAIASYREKLSLGGGTEESPAEKSAPDHSAKAKKEDETSSAWLCRLILGELPFPLLATDLEGETLFYNSYFTDKILIKPTLKNSIRLTEKYFIELTRGLLGSVYSGESFRSEQGGQLLKCRVDELNVNLTIHSLPAKEGLIGYLYIFEDPDESPLFDEVGRMLEGGASIQDALDEIEAGVINFALVKMKQNVSHAAQLLKTKRTTLQNRIKKLKLEDRFSRRVTEPVPRRKKSESAVVVSAAKKKSSSKAAPKKSSSSKSSAKKAAVRKAVTKKTPARKVTKKSGSIKSGSKKSTTKKKSVSKKASGRRPTKKSSKS